MISFATALMFGEQTGHLLHVQKKMRSHFYTVLSKTDINASNLGRIHSEVKTIGKKFQFIVCAACQKYNGLTVHIVENGTTQIQLHYHQRVCGS